MSNEIDFHFVLSNRMHWIWLHKQISFEFPAIDRYSIEWLFAVSPSLVLWFSACQLIASESNWIEPKNEMIMLNLKLFKWRWRNLLVVSSSSLHLLRRYFFFFFFSRKRWVFNFQFFFRSLAMRRFLLVWVREFESRRPVEWVVDCVRCTVKEMLRSQWRRRKSWNEENVSDGFKNWLNASRYSLFEWQVVQ